MYTGLIKIWRTVFLEKFPPFLPLTLLVQRCLDTVEVLLFSRYRENIFLTIDISLSTTSSLYIFFIFSLPEYSTGTDLKPSGGVPPSQRPVLASSSILSFILSAIVSRSN
ncbi:hypothetical protein D3C76_1611320 [compost metagenome]